MHYFWRPWNECKNPSFLLKAVCIESDHGSMKMLHCFLYSWLYSVGGFDQIHFRHFQICQNDEYWQIPYVPISSCIFGICLFSAILRELRYVQILLKSNIIPTKNFYKISFPQNVVGVLEYGLGKNIVTCETLII